MCVPMMLHNWWSLRKKLGLSTIGPLESTNEPWGRKNAKREGITHPKQKHWTLGFNYVSHTFACRLFFAFGICTFINILTMQLHHNKHMSHRNQKGASECVYVVCVCVCVSVPVQNCKQLTFVKWSHWLICMYVCMYVCMLCMYVWNNWL